VLTKYQDGLHFARFRDLALVFLGAGLFFYSLIWGKGFDSLPFGTAILIMGGLALDCLLVAAILTLFSQKIKFKLLLAVWWAGLGLMSVSLIFLIYAREFAKPP